MVQFLCAGRIGEIAGMQWNRIDFENSLIVIMETCQWDQISKTFRCLNPNPKNKEARPVQFYQVIKFMPELPDSSGSSIKLQAFCVFENESKTPSDLVTSHIFTRFHVI